MTANVDNSTEAVHRMFRGAAELSKSLRAIALTTEVVAAFIAAWRAFNPQMEWSGWASLWLALFVVAGFALRVRASYVYAFAEKCRRIATTAYACGRQVSSVVRTSLSADEPVLSKRFARRLPTQTLDDYYEPTTPTGNERLREIYAHSAFYSWRLLHVCFHMYFWVSVVLAGLGAIAIYSIAASPTDMAAASRILDVVCSIVFAFLVARALAACLSAWCSSRECRRIADELAGSITDERLREVIANYDIERSTGPAAPTAVYLRCREGLQSAWHSRRTEMGPVV